MEDDNQTIRSRWLHNTFGFRSGQGKNRPEENMVPAEDLDQYLQEVYHHLDTRGRGWIPKEDFCHLLEVLNISRGEITRGLSKDVSFAEFHARLCEYFANKGGQKCVPFLDSWKKSIKMSEDSDSDEIMVHHELTPFLKERSMDETNVRYVEFHQFNKDVRGITVSSGAMEIERRTNSLLRELTFYKEEAQSLKEIVDELKCGLQASDARNLALQVILRKAQTQQDNSFPYGVTKYNKRYSCPWDMVCYQPLAGEERSVKVLTRELSQIRELRDNEVKELMELNKQLQEDICGLSRELCDLEETNAKLVRRLESIFGSYDKHKEILGYCVSRVKELEEQVKVIPTLEEKLCKLKDLASTWKKTEESTRFEHFASDVSSETRSEPLADHADSPTEKNTPSFDNDEEMVAPEYLLLGNLQESLDEKSKALEENIKDLVRLREDLSMCRRHLLSAQFQIEALENECSRLLSLEDQIVSVVTLLQKARQQCLSRQTLGQFLLDIIDAGSGEENEDMQADKFLEALQHKLVGYPLLAHPRRSALVQEWRSDLEQVSEEGPILTETLNLDDKD